MGTMNFGPHTDEQTSYQIMDQALELGINFFDTANVYGWRIGEGVTEQIIGRWLAQGNGRRDKIVLATKVFGKMGDGPNEHRLSAMHIRQACENSLRRLQTDHLDCVHYHNIGRDDRWPSIDEVLSEKGALGALLEAKKQGMIRHIGCSTHSFPGRTLKAFDTGHFDLFMGVLNFVDRHVYDLEGKVLPEAKRRGVGVIAMKALGGPVRGPAGARLVAADYIPAMRYVWSLPEVSVAAVGFRTVEELRQGIAAARSFKRLSAPEFKELSERGKLMATQWGTTKGPVG